MLCHKRIIEKTKQTAVIYSANGNNSKQLAHIQRTRLSTTNQKNKPERTVRSQYPQGKGVIKARD